MQKKTNVMRLLDELGVDYEIYGYPEGEALSALAVAEAVGLPPEQIYKTLVTQGKSGEHYVFIIPGPASLDLKKAARAAGEKSVEMIPQAKLLPLTGYVHGGCSPFGMKKLFPTFLDENAILLERILVSAGKIGHQVYLRPDDLLAHVPACYAELIQD